MPGKLPDQEAFIAAVQSDPALRARLLADPRATISELVGVQLPEQIRVHVHEESLTDIHLVIKADPADLTDADLELISGGLFTGSCLFSHCEFGCSG